MCFLRNVLEFVSEPRTPKWIVEGELDNANSDGEFCNRKYYLRSTNDTITFSNLYDSERGNGLFTKIIDFTERLNPNKTIVIECIHNERLYPFFSNRGYTRVNNNMVLNR